MSNKEILPGNRVDLRLLQDVNREEKSGGSSGTYMTSVFDIDGDKYILHLPTQGGKILLLPLNVRYEFVFTTNNGLYKAEGTVTERFKKDNFYLMKGELTSDIVKFQRREFYRMECSIPVLFLSLEDDEGEAEKMAEVKEMIKDPSRPVAIRGLGTILDISGGGVRFISEKDLEEYNYIFVHFEVLLNNKKTNLEIVAKILAKEYNPDNRKYVYRTKFLFKDTKMQERIIRYIFEEERRNRHKKIN
ncbi:MAG: flagellar brake domain-containing protein [Lachnospiraceae bacterium]|nr:flagellar brake domain-containing protein [Lachnospiraceae bacterium]